MLKQFKTDLHIHTCLSPCADIGITPSKIVKRAIEKGIDIIAVTDHNSAENTAAAKKAAEGTGLTVLAGMEIASSEEAHILALFDDIEGIIRLQDIVYMNLMPGENDEKRFGHQIVADENDTVLGFNKRLLIGAASLTAHSIVKIIHLFGGLAIASHIDRSFFSVISQFGFIPDDIRFDALEISFRLSRKEAERKFREYNHIPWVSSSDSHRIDDIGARTSTFSMKEPTIAEMLSAFKNIDGRKVEWG